MEGNRYPCDQLSHAKLLVYSEIVLLTSTVQQYDCMMGNKMVLISRFHVTELCSVGKFPLYVWIVISSAVDEDESDIPIIAVTAC